MTPFGSKVKKDHVSYKGGCGCNLVIERMAKLGAKHAAHMHKMGAFVKDWSSNDWLLHMDEEERFIFPEMRKKGMGVLVDDLIANHEVFKREIRQYGEIRSKELLAHHAKLEDELLMFI